MKSKLLISSFFCLAAALPSQAALTFNLSNIGPGTAGPASAGALGPGDDGDVTAVYSSTIGTNSGTFSVTLSSLTLDGTGFDDDSATLNFSIVSAGGDIDDNGNDWGVSGNGGGRISDTSETLTISYTGGTISFGGGSTDVGSIDFIGFNGIDFAQFQDNSDHASISFDGGTTSQNLDVSSNTFSTNSNPMVVGYVQGDAGNDGFKINDFRARFELDSAPIPEPSSTALLGLAGVALILRRRK